MFKLNAKFDADLMLYSLSHFECNSHTVHMLTQWHLLPPLTSTVKSSLLRHTHSSLLSLAPGNIDVMQIILVILTMLDFFRQILYVMQTSILESRNSYIISVKLLQSNENYQRRADYCIMMQEVILQGVVTNSK